MRVIQRVTRGHLPCGMPQPTGTWRPLKGMSHSVKEFGKASKLCIFYSVKQPVCPFMMQANRKNTGEVHLAPFWNLLWHTVSPENQVGRTVFWERRNESDPLVYKPLERPGSVEGTLPYFWGSDEPTCPFRHQAFKQQPEAWTGNVLTRGVPSACGRYTGSKRNSFTYGQMFSWNF